VRGESLCVFEYICVENEEMKKMMGERESKD
jgi:hypothetical protein